MTHSISYISKTLFVALALASVCMFAACDEVDENDRFKEIPPVESKRNVLVEEFTGQTCTNCPDAHIALAALSEQYGSNLVVVGIHAGSFGIKEGSSDKYIGLMQDEGQQYADRWGDLDKEGYPIAGFDRRGKAVPIILGTWDSDVRAEMLRPANLDIDLSARINASGEIEINTNLKPYADINGKFQLWVVEDSVVAIQIDHGKRVYDYVHNHVYRAAVNGTWGEDVTLLPNIDQQKTNSIAIKDNWNTNHLHIVAFVYNDQDGVVQAQKAEVVK